MTDILEKSYDKWKDNTFVLGDWYKIQAAAKSIHVVKNVKSLLEKINFDFQSCHAIYFLPYFFKNSYAANEEGFALMSEIILGVDKRDPTRAVEYLKYMLDWDKYSNAAQSKAIRDSLAYILQSDISEELKTVVVAALPLPSVAGNGLMFFSPAAAAEAKPCVISEEKTLQNK